MTRIVRAEDEDALALATHALDDGELVVLPTDTLYALAADALDEDAVARVFDAKGRGADQALPVCVADYGDVSHVAFQEPLALRLADAFWPGALTLVLRAKPWLPDALTAHGSTVAVRAPANAFALDLARQFGPFTLTSANRSGQPAARDIEAAQRALGDEVVLYVDGGALPGTPSTLVDCTDGEARVLREGAVPAAEVLRVGREGHRELQESR
jgi:tRNA threonylcarbamoyl adenosine modification protein (Sua5/YciO/YrdC/YwlC family)